jgi:hypothetical protein
MVRTRIKVIFLLYFVFKSIALLAVNPPQIPKGINGLCFVPANIEGVESDIVAEIIPILAYHGYSCETWLGGDPFSTSNPKINNFMDLMKKQYSFLIVISQGSHDKKGWLVMEFFGTEKDAKVRLEELRKKYAFMGQFPGNDELDAYKIREGPLADKFIIAISDKFLMKRLGGLPKSIVFIDACNSGPELPDVFTNRGAGCAFGWNGIAISEEIAAPAAIFARMGGYNNYWAQQGDDLRNKSAQIAINEYANPKLVMSGNSGMKLYNSSRIAGVLIKQGENVVYQYGAYGHNPQSYPYEWDYPGDTKSGMKEAVNIGDEVINVKILFSSFMDEEMLDEVRVKSEKGGGENYVVSGGWTGGTIFGRDVWEGTFTIDSWEDTASKAVLVVDAKDDFEGDVNERLDTDGDGNSNGVDERHKFKVTGLPTVKNQCAEKGDGGSLQNLVLSNSSNLATFTGGSVCFLESRADELPVDISKLYFTFSKPMNETTTTPAVSAPFGFTTSWDGEETIELNLNDTLDYCEDYTVTISGDATDTSGVHLDGDENGEPYGDYFFNFTTEPPEALLYINPFVAHVEEGCPLRADLITNGNSLKKEIDCDIDFNVYNPGRWSVSGPGELSFSLSPGEIHEDGFTINNSGARFPLMIFSKIPFKCDETSCMGFYWSAEGHMADHPDENQSPGKMEYPTPWLIRTQSSPPVSTKLRASSPSSDLPDIGILLSGWADGYGHILGKYGIETLPVKPDLEIINNPDVDISDAVKLFVIGSAGLKGFNSQEFKQKLEDYVVNGGNLLVFTQKYGSDLSVLPGEIDGYGWNEDQSCFRRAAYLNQWHPVFAGQTKQVMNCNVDGYISEYPDNSEVLLGRTKNATPALIYYNYGAGTVIVSSLYSDWGYGHSQTSTSELKIIRDLTTWALDPNIEIPEFYYNSPVTVPVSIKYTANDTIPATRAIVKIYTPERELYDSTSIPVSLNSGGESEWIWEKSSISYNLGLWVIDYALMDDSGKWIQGYNRGAVFAQKVKVSIGDYNLGDFEIWANSDEEKVLDGDTTNFEIFVRNNTDSTFEGKIMIGVHEEKNEGGRWWKVIDSITGFTVPSNTLVDTTFARELFISSSVYFGIYDNAESSYPTAFRNALASCEKGVWVIHNPFSIFLSRDKHKYVLGFDTVHYEVTVKNRLSYPCSLCVNTYTLLDSVRYELRKDTIELAGKDKKVIDGCFFPVDYDTTLGKEILRSELFYRDILRKSKRVKFKLTYPGVRCSLSLPDSFNYEDSNPYTLTLSSEADYIPPGELLLSGPNYSDSLTIGYIPRAETTLVFDYQPNVWEIYEDRRIEKLTIQYKNEGQTISKTENLNFRFPLISSLRPEYPKPHSGFIPRDTATFKAKLSLKGRLYGVPLEFCLWSDYLGVDTLRDTIVLNPCSHRTISLKTYTDMSIPADTLISYNYRMNYLSKEYTTTEELQYFVQSPEAVLHWPTRGNFSIGETIEIKYTNSIKAPSRVDIERAYLRGKNGERELFDGPGEVEIPGEGSYIFPITVPQWKNGQYYLVVESEMIEGRGVNLDLYEEGCPIYIDGIEADIQVSTPKDYYGYGDYIPFSSLLENGQYGWNGAESLKVARVRDSIGEFSIWDATESIDTFGLIPDGSGGLVLDSVYSIGCLWGEAADELPLSNAFNRHLRLGGYSGTSYSIAIDEWNNLWISDNDERIIEKFRGFPYLQPPDTFSLSDSVGNIKGIVPHQGIIYLIASDSGRVYKMNSTSGEISGNIQPPGRRFLYLTGVAIKEGGNVLAVEDGTKTLWEFSNSGDSISTFDLPPELHYGDMEYYDGTIYISTYKKIITVEGTLIDSFGVSPDLGDSYGPIAIDDNGKIAVARYKWPDDAIGSVDKFGKELYGNVILMLFSSTGDIEAELYWLPPFYDLTFYKKDIISYEYVASYSNLGVYKEFGKENGLIRAGYWDYFENLPEEYRFLSYKNSDSPNSGSILYQSMSPSGYPSEEDLSPLESSYGSDELLPIAITVQGDWHDSPVFYDCLLKLKVLDVFDSLIVKNVYDLNLSAFDNVSFADTIQDTIPAGDYCVFGSAYSEYPQSIASDWKLFTVIGDNLALLLKSDKEEGFAGDTFSINPIAINPLPLEEDNLRLLVKGYYTESETTYVDTSFDLLGESADSFPFTIIPEEPLIIEAELIISSSDTIRREFAPIVKSGRMLSLNVSAPEIADLLPFRVTSEIYNYSFEELSLEVRRIFLADTLSDSVSLEVEGVYTFVDTFTTEEAGTLKVVAAAGNETFEEKKFIDFGMTGVVQLDSLYEVSPDSIEMSGIIRNEGLYPLECDALFCLIEDDGTYHGTDVKNSPISIPGGKQFSTSSIGYSHGGTETQSLSLKYLTASPAPDISHKDTKITKKKSGNDLTIQQFNNLTADLSAKRMALSSVHKVGKEIAFSQFVRQLTRAGVDTSFSAVYLSPWKTDTIPIMFNKHDVGSYELLAFLFTDSQSFMFDSTSSNVNVVGDNQVFVDSLFVSENCDTNGTVLLTAVLNNRSFSPFSGSLTISSLICYFDSLVSLPLHSKDTLKFLLEDPVDEGTYTFTSVILEGGIPVSQKSQNIEFHPVYRFDSLPIDLEVSTPDSGIIKVPVSNIGIARGERNIRVNLADVITINADANIEPSASDTFTGNILIPEDFPGGEYFADAFILKNVYPEVDTFFNVKVNGLVIQAEDSLDKLVYSVDDTAECSILIRNQSLWSGYLLASLQYGELELDTSFILGGMEKGILNETFPRDTIYLDTSGIYMFDPLSTESYDSVRINWNASLSDSLVFQMRTDSLIGRGDWITLEKGGTYILDDWMQINFANKSSGVQWIDAICLYFNSLGCTKLDTFPLQREIVTFAVPVDSSQEKLGWGIYYPSGRSVVLDERYVYLSDSMLSIFTDKGRYEILDTVYATVCKNFPDTNYNFEYRVYFSPIEEVRDTFVLNEDTTNFSFVIPEWTRSGTYSIDYWVEDTVLPAGGLQLTASFSTQHTADNRQLTATHSPKLTANSSQLTANNNLTTQPLNNLTAVKENNNYLTIQPFDHSTDSKGESLPLAKQWAMGKPSISASGDSAFISGEHLFDVNGITIYFKNAKMDTNLYFNGEKAKIRTEISSDIDLMVGLNISSTGSAVKDTNLNLEKDIPNKFEFEYPITGCKRGMNELYLHLAKDSVSLAGIVLYFDVYVSDTTPPAISVLEKPSNTYSSNRSYQLRARIYDPETNGTPFNDTLYYRIASVGGSSWQALLVHSMKGDTHKYLIPSHPNGTHIEYNLIARDEFGNRARYPEEGNEDFWILSPLKPTWDELIYLADTSAVLIWNPPEELIYYHCGLCSDTIDIKENTIAARFTTQCLPAVLKTIGLEIVKESGTLSDTLTVSVYTVAGDSLPGTKIDSFEFTGTLEGYTELSLSDIQIPEDGIFIGVKGSNGLNALLDGFGEGSHTAIDSGSSWELATSGELLIDGIILHLPTPKTRGSSEILTFDVFRSIETPNWVKIASGLTFNTYTDEATQENQEYSYKIMASFGNPVDSFLSTSREVFIDVSPPEMDTIAVNEMGENELVIWAVLTDTSGIAWDSLGYKNGDTINLIPDDSIKNNQYFFSITFADDTLEYFLKTKDASLIGNYARYPASGFYKWGSYSGIHEVIPDSTFLFRMVNVLVGRNIEIRYALSEESDVQIMFFDILGRKARTLVDKTQKAGYYSTSVRATELPQGIYFLRMEAGEYRKTVKLVKVR